MKIESFPLETSNCCEPNIFAGFLCEHCACIYVCMCVDLTSSITQNFCHGWCNVAKLCHCWCWTMYQKCFCSFAISSNDDTIRMHFSTQLKMASPDLFLFHLWYSIICTNEFYFICSFQAKFFFSINLSSPSQQMNHKFVV